MKKSDVRSGLKKRLIPLLLVPTLLGSNLISIQAFADAEESIADAVEAVAEEQSENETPVVEESSDNSENTNEESQNENDQNSDEETVENQENASEESSEEAATESSSEEEATSESSDEASDDASDEASDEASAETSEEAVTESSDEAAKETSKESENKILVSVADFTFPVQLVVEGVEEDAETSGADDTEENTEATSEESTQEADDTAALLGESKIAVFAVSEDGSQLQLSENEAVDVKVDGVEVVTTKTVEVGGNIEASLDDSEESDEASEESAEESSDEESSENVVSEETTIETSGTPAVSFGFEFDQENYEIESVMFNDQELDFADEYTTLNIDSDSLSIDEQSVNFLTVSLVAVEDNQPVIITSGDDIIINGEYDEETKTYLGENIGLAVAVEDDRTKEGNLDVYFTINGELVKATYDDKLNKYVWYPEDAGDMKLYKITKVSVSDKKNPDVTADFSSQLSKASKDGAVTDLSLSYANSWQSGKWISLAGDQKLKLNVKFATANNVKSVKIGKREASIVDKQGRMFSWLVDYKATAELSKSDLDDAEYDGLSVTVEYLDYSTGKVKKVTRKCPINIKIDSTAPKVEGITHNIYDPIKTNEATSWQQFLYWFGVHEIVVDTNIPSSNMNISGMGYVELEYTPILVNEKYEIVRRGEKKTVKCSVNGTDTYTATIRFLEQEGVPVIFELGNVILHDGAGNTSNYEGTANNIVAIDSVSVYSEAKTEGKHVVYEYKGEEIEFFDQPVKEEITVRAYNLDKEKSVSFKINGEDDKNGDVKLVNVVTCAYDSDEEVEEGRIKQLDYEFVVKEDEEKYQIETTAYSKAAIDGETRYGTAAKNLSPILVCDRKAPDIKIEFVSDKKIEGKDVTYTNKDVTIRAIATDKWFVTDRCEGNEQVYSRIEIKYTDPSGNSRYLDPVTKWTQKEGTNDYVAEFTVSEDGEYEVTAYAYDVVNEVSKVGYDAGETSYSFTLDKTLPDVHIEFDQSDVKNGKYYNTDKTATITVTDFTFDPNLTNLSVSEERGTYSEGGWEQSGITYTKQITFSQDGKYSIAFDCTDKAGNGPVSDKVDEFVVDKTEPKINVYYTGGAANNEMYYNAARTATIEIDDMSFDANLVEYTAQAIDQGSALPVLGTFTSSEDTNTAIVSFDQDGKYGYVINCTDLAGNSCTSFVSDVFVIDTTAPEVSFSGVENFSANNGVVAPVVSYSDKYMDMNVTNVQMIGSNNGVVSLGSTTAQTENGFVVSYSDFAHDKSMDDLYTLKATVVDLAGNKTEGELVFSVNRHGSVFVLGDATKELNDKYYTKEPQDVVVTEINVDELTYRDVSISRDGDVTELKKDKNYQVTKQGNDVTWKTYTYTISKDNFKKDGVYSVTVYTEDRATNAQDNKSRDAEVNFAVDSTKPSVVSAGMENGFEVYEVESYDFNLDIADNMMLESIKVYDDDQELLSYDKEQILENTDAMVVTIKGTNEAKKRTIKVVAEDVAGNVETVVYSNVIVSTKEKPAVEGKKRSKDDTIDPDDITRNIIIWVIIGLGAIALASGTGYTIYKKKK